MKLRLQSILYNTDTDSLKRAYQCVVWAVACAKKTGFLCEVEFAYGDCSPTALLDQDVVDSWVQDNQSVAFVPIHYTFFDANKGSAAGHNALMQLVESETKGKENRFLIIMNPDIKMAGDTIIHLVKTLFRPNVGLVEGRQLPFELPKAYDERSGYTSWGSTATAITTTDIFWQVGGFDAETFFLYCDDVDFSWMVREQGYKIVFQPAATVYHDKRLVLDGNWPTNPNEVYYSAEASLLLSYKWSRPDLTEKYLRNFKSSDHEYLKKAASAFEAREKAGRLPSPRDHKHEIGTFIGSNYSKSRF